MLLFLEGFIHLFRPTAIRVVSLTLLYTSFFLGCSSQDTVGFGNW